MADRADYLAKTLLSRLRSLEGVLRDDHAPSALRDRRREELVEKVLAIEIGVVDSAVTRLVLSALPTLRPQVAATDQEQREFADFLRTRLRTLSPA